jgi:hypothetical protein
MSNQIKGQTKITNSNQSHKSHRKYKSENRRIRTSEYIRGGIRCHGVGIPFLPVTPAVSPNTGSRKRYEPWWRPVCQEWLLKWFHLMEYKYQIQITFFMFVILKIIHSLSYTLVLKLFKSVVVKGFWLYIVQVS